MVDAPTRFVRPLNAEEQTDLERLRQQAPRTLGLRAEAILLSARRVPIPEIMRRLGVSRPTVAGWLTRFERAGVPGLLSRPRSGRPRKLTPDFMRHLATAAKAPPRSLGLDRPTWTLSALRAHLVRAGHVPAISAGGLAAPSASGSKRGDFRSHCSPPASASVQQRSVRRNTASSCPETRSMCRARASSCLEETCR